MYSTLYQTMRLFWPGGMETRRHLRELERLERLSQQELEDWQFERLQEVVRYAYEHVPYYRERYRREDIHPDDIRSLQDFRALPFLTREDVNENLAALTSPEVAGELYPVNTGGSTGEPMRFFVDGSYWWWAAALEWRARRWHGVREGDKVAWVWGAPQEMGGWNRGKSLKARIMRQRYLHSHIMTEAKMQAFAEMLIVWQPDMFRASPSGLTLFARFIKERQITGIRPRLVETSAEKLSSPQREILEEVFQCPVADSYSCREMAMVAYQCEMGGRHVCETRFLETLSSDGLVLPGQIGEVALTSLSQFAMPFIRYKVGDLAILDPEPCSCGRALPVLQEIVGKKHDILLTADGRFVYGGYFTRLFRVRPEVTRFQVYQPDKGSLEVRFICNQQVEDAWLQDLSIAIQEHFGASMRIALHQVDEIPLTSAGKHRFVISDVKPEFA